MHGQDCQLCVSIMIFVRALGPQNVVLGEGVGECHKHQNYQPVSIISAFVFSGNIKHSAC